MRIAILAHGLHVSGGISVGKNIVATLPKIAPQHEYLITIPPGLGYETHDGKKNVSVIEIESMSLYKRIYFDLLVLPKLAKEFNPDVIVGLGNMGLFKPPYKQAFLFHRTQLVYSRNHYRRRLYGYWIRFRRMLLKKGIRKCLRHTQVVFCQTPIAKERFSKTFNFPSNQIKIMPNAISEFIEVPEVEIVKPNIYEHDAYFNLFFLTSYYPHKNLEILIKIFKKHREKLHGIRCIITISGEQYHKKAQNFLNDVEKNDLQEYILNAGPLEQKELAGYFYHSDALFFPTLLESFSATYLEAMHFGVPILTSDLDFARNICDDAAVYFDPWDPGDIVEKILLVKNSPPQLRKELIEKGKRRVSTFYKSWEEILSDVMNELEQLVKI